MSAPNAVVAVQPFLALARSVNCALDFDLLSFANEAWLWWSMDAPHRRLKKLAGLPTCRAALTRHAVAHVRAAQIDLKPLLLRAGMTVAEVNDPDTPIAVPNQVAFLDLAADALGDDCLGLTLATEFDCRRPRPLVLRARVVRDTWDGA